MITGGRKHRPPVYLFCLQLRKVLCKKIIKDLSQTTAVFSAVPKNIGCTCHFRNSGCKDDVFASKFPPGDLRAQCNGHSGGYIFDQTVKVSANHGYFRFKSGLLTQMYSMFPQTAFFIQQGKFLVFQFFEPNATLACKGMIRRYQQV